jgi:hypothetical protein
MGRNLDIRLGSCEGITDPGPTPSAAVRRSAQGQARTAVPIDDRGLAEPFAGHGEISSRGDKAPPQRGQARTKGRPARQKSLYDSLEQEMASLSGRSGSKTLF